MELPEDEEVPDWLELLPVELRLACAYAVSGAKASAETIAADARILSKVFMTLI